MTDDGSSNTAAATNSLLANYALVLNTVVAAMRKLGHSLVVRGFLNDASCLAYFPLHRRPDGIVKDFEAGAGYILVGNPQRISLLPDDPTAERAAELNQLIRRAKTRSLGLDHPTGTEVKRIEEFALKLGNGKTLEIPLGAPGIGAMIASLPLAIEAQLAPDRALQKTVAEAGLSRRDA